MNPTPLLTLLGLTTLLPCVPALTCQSRTTQTMKTVSELPFKWTAGRRRCQAGEGCQDTLMLIANGPQVNVLVVKDCTTAEDQEALVTQHRAGPGLSVVSYTHVCRNKDFCNSMQSTEVLGTLPTPAVPGPVRCPLCLSSSLCDNAPEQACPEGHTHCYSGTLRLRSEEVISNLRVRGCLPEPGCNLLNGTQRIGPIDVSEDCRSALGPQILDCYSGTIETIIKVSDLHLGWTMHWQTCAADEGCFENVMLIDNGQQVNLLVNKGCTVAENQNPEVTRHLEGPGIAITSYAQVCRQKDFCNDYSTTNALWTPPPAPGPGTLHCPFCIAKFGCENAKQRVCPAGLTHCYQGVFKFRGGNIATNLRVQGCVRQPGCNLINGPVKLGPIDLSEDCTYLAVKILRCQKGTLETIMNVTDLPFQWKAGRTKCKVGEGCQDTLMMIQNGHQVSLVLTKGCTTTSDHEVSITKHRTSPGFSFISYTHVCSRKNYCNELSTTAPLWVPPPVAVPGTLHCPLCLSTSGCENVPKQVCPAGNTHCYNGVLRLRGGNIATRLNVWGCMPQPGCDLLNGTQEIGPVHVSEDCNPQSDTLTCHKGVLVKFGRDLSKNPVEWTASEEQICVAGELCQETLLLIDVGHHSLLLGSKGCTEAGTQDITGVTHNSLPPGMVVASYFRFCSDSDLCNSARLSSELLDTFPQSAGPAPGHLQCPACVQFSGSCNNSELVACAQGTSHCYSGNIELTGGGLSGTVSIQGCMASSSKLLLSKNKTIGIFSVNEELARDTSASSPVSPNGVAPGCHGQRCVLKRWDIATTLEMKEPGGREPSSLSVSIAA
uniref:CD177 antigen n=1 Tax=Jaculus jaculus TaxID=51337 RepID=UPI001E1B113C|nr:CD177 antigen [Jaculus jaculus]